MLDKRTPKLQLTSMFDEFIEEVNTRGNWDISIIGPKTLVQLARILKTNLPRELHV